MTSDVPILPDADPAVREHLENVAENLQLLADLGYGDTALLVGEPDGALRVAADARPTTAVAAVASSRVGSRPTRSEEPEAYEALETGSAVSGARRRKTRGMAFSTSAYPLGPAGTPYAVLVRDLTEQVLDAPGAMERQFMAITEALARALGSGPFRDAADGSPFTTTRVAGDGVIRLDEQGTVGYASPNAVNIMRLAGVERSLRGMPASELPGGSVAVAPAFGEKRAAAATVEVGGRVLRFRTISFDGGALVLVDDVTEARQREQELKVKDATIREVHHRVKNNLQTIASLLRIQARRATTDEASRALSEAVERVSSMAIVHEMLTGSTDEAVDFAAVARTVVDMVRQGLAGGGVGPSVIVEGRTGEVPARVATSLSLALAELVHNAIEHGLEGRDSGIIQVSMRRLPGELSLIVRDEGKGIPPGFDPNSAGKLGIAIVRTIVEDDLRGSLQFSRGRGTTVTMRVPLTASEGD